MSFDISNIREIPNDPFAKFAAKLSKKLSRFLNKQQTDKLENKEDIYSSGQDVESVIKLHTFNSQNYFNFGTDFYSASEPDDDATCRLWLKGFNMGNTLRDFSDNRRDGILFGEPLLIDGAPFDYGIHSGGIKSVALRFNRPTSATQNQEFIAVTTNLQHMAMEGLVTGISFFLRFRIHSLSEQDGWARTLYQKRDDETPFPNNGIRVMVDTSGRLIVRIVRNGTQYNNQTATSTISTNTVYDLWITYAVSGNVIHVYVNNADKSLTDPGVSSNWDTDQANKDWHIFKHANSDNGYVYGDFYDFEILREKVASSTEIGRHWINKWTLANIPFGQVMVANFWATSFELPPSGSGSYTSSSYTSGSFTT